MQTYKTMLKRQKAHQILSINYLNAQLPVNASLSTFVVIWLHSLGFYVLFCLSKFRLLEIREILTLYRKSYIWAYPTNFLIHTKNWIPSEASFSQKIWHWRSLKALTKMINFILKIYFIFFSFTYFISKWKHKLK